MNVFAYTLLTNANPRIISRSLASDIEERDEAVSKYLHIHRDLQQARRDLSAVQVQVLGMFVCQLQGEVFFSSMAVLSTTGTANALIILRFMACVDCQDDNRAIAQSLALETAAMKETMASQDSKSSRRMAHR